MYTKVEAEQHIKGHPKEERLLKLLNLPVGWYVAGESFPVSPDATIWAADMWKVLNEVTTQQFGIYPTLSGGVSLEQKIGKTLVVVEYEAENDLEEIEVTLINPETSNEEFFTLTKDESFYEIPTKLENFLVYNS